MERGYVVEGLDPPDRVGQGFVAAALGVRREVVGMAAVVAAFRPAAEDEEAPADVQVFVEMLRNGGRLVERPVHLDRLRFGAVFVHMPGEARPELHVGCPNQPLGARIALDLLA